MVKMWQKVLVFSFLLTQVYYLIGMKISAPTFSYRPNNFKHEANFGKTNGIIVDETIHDFKINLEEEVLEDLKRRLENTRLLHSNLEGISWEYGTNIKYLRELLLYWKDSFIINWRKQEHFLNDIAPQFLTKIDGLNIHFVHIKADREIYSNVYPLILLHGWPGSFFEFYKVVSFFFGFSKVRLNYLILP